MQGKLTKELMDEGIRKQIDKITIRSILIVTVFAGKFRTEASGLHGQRKGLYGKEVVKDTKLLKRS